MTTIHFVFRLFTGILMAALSVAAVQAQAPRPVTQGGAVTVTAVIEAIDTSNRLVTLKAPDGTLAQVLCGPDVQRFDQLKVGQTVTFNYYESIVYAIAAPGAAAPPAGAAPTLTRREGNMPGGTLSQQVTAIVTIRAIDPAVPSVTIERQDGTRVSMRVEDKKNLDGVKVGDRVQVTFTQALAISVK